MFVALLVFPLWLAAVLGFNHLYPVDTSEGGWLEIGQAGLLLTASVLWLRVAWMSPARTDGAARDRQRLAVIAPLATALFLLFFLRELGFGRVLKLTYPDATMVLAAATGLTLLAILVSLRSAARSGWPPPNVQMIWHPAIGLTVLGGCLMIVGDGFEKQLIPIWEHVLMEEASEIYAAMLFCVGARKAQTMAFGM